MNLAEVWRHLEEDDLLAPAAARVQRRIMPEFRRDFFLGLELPSRSRMLILRASPDSVVGQTSVPESGGLTVRMSSRTTDPPAAEVELILTAQQHRDIFDLLIEDLVRAAEQPDDERVGVGRFLARLTDWQRLLMRLGSGALSRESQQGLWGELWTLREVVGPVVGFERAVWAWRGALGADQDVQLPRAGLEVKTSTAHSFEHLVIASERQLDVDQDIALALLALSLDARPGHGETLPVMVRAVRALAADAGCLNLFEERLTLVSYRPEDEHHYDDIGYTIQSRRQFGVRGDFPRITAADLRPGVSDVGYAIATTACLPFEISDGALDELLRGAL